MTCKSSVKIHRVPRPDSGENKSSPPSFYRKKSLPPFFNRKILHRHFLDKNMFSSLLLFFDKNSQPLFFISFKNSLRVMKTTLYLYCMYHASMNTPEFIDPTRFFKVHEFFREGRSFGFFFIFCFYSYCISLSQCGKVATKIINLISIN